MIGTPLRPTVLEVDLAAAAHNVRAVRQLVGPDRALFAVIKADGYGYGAAEMGAVFAKNGADYLAVADLAEGVRLRQRGVTTPILVYPNSLPAAAGDAIRHGLVPTLVDFDAARAYAAAASGPCDIFVKIDVGLERLGLPAEEAVEAIVAMLALPHLRLAGICAHPHAELDGDPAYADWQLARFTTVIDTLEQRGIRVPIRLVAATPWVLRFPATYMNAVDPGRMLYGMTFPGEAVPVTLRPTFRALTTRLIQVKTVRPRERFAGPFPVTGAMRLGVIPMGAADGLRWLHAGHVLVRGHQAPIVGSPSLEHTRIDLTAVPDAAVGDEVVIIGRQGAAEITVADVASRNTLGLHHVATTVGARVARVYVS